MRNQRGFSVIEALIIVAIILIIVAIAIPNVAVTKAKEDFPKFFGEDNVPESPADCSELLIGQVKATLADMTVKAANEHSGSAAKDALSKARRSARIVCGVR